MGSQLKKNKKSKMTNGRYRSSINCLIFPKPIRPMDIHIHYPDNQPQKPVGPQKTLSLAEIRRIFVEGQSEFKFLVDSGYTESDACKFLLEHCGKEK